MIVRHPDQSPSVSRYVYDGEMEQQMYMLFDANRKLLGTGDIYPSAVQLTKGEYTLRLVLRHDSPQLLDKFRALPMVCPRAKQRTLTAQITFDDSRMLSSGQGTSWVAV